MPSSMHARTASRAPRRVVDAPAVVGGRDAVLGHVDRSARPCPRVADALADGGGVVLPAGERALGVRRRSAAGRPRRCACACTPARPTQSSPSAASRKTSSRDGAVLGGDRLGARDRLVGLRGDRPSGPLARAGGRSRRARRCASTSVAVTSGTPGGSPTDGKPTSGSASTETMLGSLIVQTSSTSSSTGKRGFRVAGEPLGRGIRVPPAVTGEPDRVREVVQRDHRLQAEVASRRDHAPVVIDRGARDPALLGLDPRPLDAEAVGVQARRREQRHVFGVAVVAVGGVAGRRLDRRVPAGDPTRAATSPS